MGFGFSKAQERFRNKVRDFLEETIKPDLESAPPSKGFPRDLWMRIGRFGLLGVGLPESYGGSPGDCVIRGIVAEEVGRVDLALAFALVPSYGTSLGIMQGGSKEQKENWIPGIIRGEKLGSMGMTEPDSGSDLSSIRTSARREGEYYLLNGEKSYVSWGLIADVIWLFAKSEAGGRPSRLSCFLVPLDMPGISKSSFSQMGLCDGGHCSVLLDDLRIPLGYRLGSEGGAFHLASKVFPHTRMILSLTAIGLAQSSQDEAISFSRERRAFGRSLGSFEEISFRLAEDATMLEAARWLCYRTLWMMDQGIRCVKEIAMCKWWSSELALRIIHNALLIHGHKGYSTQLPFERRYRDMIGYEIAEATPHILKLTISEEILGKDLRPFC